jgi:3-hydroxyacyl-[acyl-carrier-protein] dehydratase
MSPGWLEARGLEPCADLRPDALSPQRPPLLLVGRVDGVRRGERPAVAASLEITGAEPVLAGHFPGEPVWPGSYTIEGLAQACAVAGALAGGFAVGSGPHGSARAAAERETGQVALVASFKVKLTGVIAPPTRLDYFVELAHVVDGIARFSVEASVGGREVARGSIDVVWSDAAAGAP